MKCYKESSSRESSDAYKTTEIEQSRYSLILALRTTTDENV